MFGDPHFGGCNSLYREYFNLCLGQEYVDMVLKRRPLTPDHSIQDAPFVVHNKQALFKVNFTQKKRVFYCELIGVFFPIKIQQRYLMKVHCETPCMLSDDAIHKKKQKLFST